MVLQLPTDVLRRAALLVAEPLVLEREQADSGEPGGRRGGHPLVELPEPRPAEVRPDEVRPLQVLRRGHGTETIIRVQLLRGDR